MSENDPTTFNDLKAALAELALSVEHAAREKAGGIEDEIKTQHDRATRFIRENPLTSVLGALAIGYLIARVSRRERVIYVEKETP